MNKVIKRFPWIIFLLTALAPIIWGSTYIVTTELIPQDRPFTAALLRCLPAGVLLLLFKPNFPFLRNFWKLIILSALNISIFQALLFVAAYHLPGGLAAVIGATQPMILLLLVWWADNNKPSNLTIFSTVFAVFGMSLLLLNGEMSWSFIGVSAAFLGAVSMAAGVFLAKRWRGETPIIAFTGWQLLLGGLMLLPLAWVFDPAIQDISIIDILGYSYLCLFGAVIAYSLWFFGIANISPLAVSALGLLSPLTAVILGWLFLDQFLSPIALLGLTIVLGSIFVLQWGSSNTAPKPPTRTKPITEKHVDRFKKHAA